MTDETIDSVGKRTAIGAGWMIAWRMVTRSLGMISTLVLARLLVPADFGLVAMATAFSSAIDAFSALGLQEALIRRKENDWGLYDTAFTMQAIRGLLTAAVLAAGASAAGTWFEEPRLFPILLLLAATAAVAGFENIAIVEYRRALRFSMEFKLLFLPRICQFAVTIAMASTMRSYWALVIGIVTAKLIRLAMTYVLHPYRPKLALLRWRELVGFSFWTWVAGLATLAWERLDSFILGPAFGAAVLGVYMLAAEVAVLPISELVQPATGALFAGVAAARARGLDTTEVAMPVISALLLLVMPLGIGVSATSGYLVVALLGPNWAAARPLIAVFALVCAVMPVSFAATSILVASGHVRRNFYAVAGAASFKLVLLSVAVMAHDLLTFAVASTGCAVAEACFYMIQLWRCGVTVDRLAAGGLARIAISSLIVSLILYESGFGWQQTSLSNIPALIYGGLIGLATILAFAGVQMLQWHLIGRPDGPEVRVLGTLRQFTGKWTGRRTLVAGTP
jgi:O-antigen/teichoic acid export membrane protein